MMFRGPPSSFQKRRPKSSVSPNQTGLSRKTVPATNTYFQRQFPATTRETLAQVTIDGSHLSIDLLLEVARNGAQTVVAKEALARADNGRRALERLMKKKTVIYGVNTGFGALSNYPIPTEDLKQLQTNLVRSHAASVGKPLPSDVVRAMMLLRANTLLKGNSGIRPEIVSTIVRLLNKEIHPYIPEKGSVGASGDLSPLSSRRVPTTCDHRSCARSFARSSEGMGRCLR